MRTLLPLLILLGCTPTELGVETFTGTIDSARVYVTDAGLADAIVCRVATRRVPVLVSPALRPDAPHCVLFWNGAETATYSLYVERGPIGDRYRVTVAR